MTAGSGPAAGERRPDPAPLLRPRSVAVVGANDRPGSYADNVLRNLAAAGFEGPVWGVNPKRGTVHGHPCVPNLAALPEPVDAVVVAIPAAGVPAVLAEAGARGCGGAIVLAAGFGETAAGAGLEAELRATAREAALPVCGPNGNGVFAVAARAPLWGDSVGGVEAGPVALITQSGNVGVNALGSRRGLGFHTVVSCGNQAVLDTSDWVEAVAALDGVGSIALFVEADGDGARLARALGRCAERGIGVAALKVGSSAAGARAAGAHTGALAGDHRVFAALLEEAGAALAADPGELLELARALAVPRARPAGDGGLAVLTCSGGDSGVAADLAARAGLRLPPLAPATRERLAALLPAAATIANPLDYTSLLWDQPAVLEQVAEAVGADPGIDQLLLFFDQPDGLAADVAAEWEGVRAALVAGAERSGAAVLLASTLSELLEPASARALGGRGIAAAAGLGEAIACAKALRAAPPEAGRMEAIARAAAGTADRVAARDAAPRDGTDRAPGEGSGWLGEVEAKALLRAGGLEVPAGREAASVAEAAAVAGEVGWPVALKLSSPALQHKSEAGALLLDVHAEEVEAAAARLLSLPAAGGATLLVEAMGGGGPELLFAVHRDGVVPVLVVGLGGIWAEALDDVALVPLPASPAAVERALGRLRGAGLFGGGRGRPACDLAAAGRFGSRLGELLLEHRLDLLEVNPAVLADAGARCVALDAVARRRT
ncbi:MAG: acetate--CoA ligase family protein [Solirubrobacterales bacterium]